MNYEERLTCFIDILGFKSAIEQSLKQDEVREGLYNAIHVLKSERLLDQVYGDIPFFLLDKECTIKPSREVINGDIKEQYSSAYPITITQFSDSFVLSCPVNNHASCSMLLECVYLVHLIYYYNLGMMIRGGISVGKLVHEESGALFGPAMNEAYALESKSAIYPRVVLSQEASALLTSILESHPVLKPIKKSFDGHDVFDLISIFMWPKCKEFERHEVDAQLREIETDILENSSISHPKIAYLLEQWELYKSQHNKKVFSPANNAGFTH
jgi:hypothetical protein